MFSFVRERGNRRVLLRRSQNKVNVSVGGLTPPQRLSRNYICLIFPFSSSLPRSIHIIPPIDDDARYSGLVVYGSQCPHSCNRLRTDRRRRRRRLFLLL